MRHQRLHGELERGNGLLAGHGREVVEELAERLTRLERVEKGLHGDARTDEYPHAAENVGIALNHRRGGRHGSPLPRLYTTNRLARNRASRLRDLEAEGVDE